MTEVPDASAERPNRMIRRRIAVILSIAAVPAVWMGYEMLDDVACGCVAPAIDRQPAP